ESRRVPSKFRAISVFAGSFQPARWTCRARSKRSLPARPATAGGKPINDLIGAGYADQAESRPHHARAEHLAHRTRGTRGDYPGQSLDPQNQQSASDPLQHPRSDLPRTQMPARRPPRIFKHALRRKTCDADVRRRLVNPVIVETLRPKLIRT